MTSSKYFTFNIYIASDNIYARYNATTVERSTTVNY